MMSHTTETVVRQGAVAQTISKRTVSDSMQLN